MRHLRIDVSCVIFYRQFNRIGLNSEPNQVHISIPANM